MATTSYDAIHYPAGMYPEASPSNLATVAILCGLEPPDPIRPRVLEIGCGSGLNLIAQATSHPEGEFVGLDLAATAIEAASQYAADCGLGNIRFEVADILQAARDLDGEYDYIICHGVYAWVPEPVREAIMTLIARLLAPNGVAYVCYNAKPGSQLRQIVREMVLHEVGHVEPAEQRMSAALAFLKSYAAEDDDGDITQRLMRGLARIASGRPPEVIIHDELGEVFEPQSIVEFTCAAAGHGLDYLHDAVGPFGPPLAEEGEDESSLAVAHRVMARDYRAMTFFHWSLLVRSGQRPARRITREALSRLWVSSRAIFLEEEGKFKVKKSKIEVNDSNLRDGIRSLFHQVPKRVRVDEFFPETAQARQIIDLYDNGLIELSPCQWPFPFAPGDRPSTSNLVLKQVNDGAPVVSGLNLNAIDLTDAAARSLVRLLDGSRGIDQIETDWRAGGESQNRPLDVGLRLVTRMGLLSN